MRERPVAPVGEDLLDDGMAAVVPSAWISSKGEPVKTAW